MATESKKKTIIQFDPKRGPTHPGLRPSWSQIRVIFQLEDIDEEISDSLNYIMSLDRGYRGAVITSPIYNFIGIMVREKDGTIPHRTDIIEKWKKTLYPIDLTQNFYPKYLLEPMVIFDLPGYLESLARVVESMDGGEKSKASRVAITETARILRSASKSVPSVPEIGNYKETIKAWLERIMSSEEIQNFSQRILGERGPGNLHISPIHNIRSTGIQSIDEEKVANYLERLIINRVYEVNRGLRSGGGDRTTSGAGTLLLSKGVVISPINKRFWLEKGEDGGILIGMWDTDCEIGGGWCANAGPKEPKFLRDNIHVVVPMLVSRKDGNGTLPISLEIKEEKSDVVKYRVFYIVTASVKVVPLLEREMTRKQRVVILGSWAGSVVSKALRDGCIVNLEKGGKPGPYPQVIIDNYWGIRDRIREGPYSLVIQEESGEEEDPSNPRTKGFLEPTKVEIRLLEGRPNEAYIAPYSGAPYGRTNRLPSVILGTIKWYAKSIEIPVEKYLHKIEKLGVPMYKIEPHMDRSYIKERWFPGRPDEKVFGIMTHLISIIYYKSQVEKYRLCYPVPKGTSKAERRTVEMLEREAKEIAEQSWEGGSLMRALLDLYSKCPEEEKEQGRKVVIREMVGVQGEQVRPLGKRVEITLKLGEYKSNNLEETLYLWVQHAVDV